MANFYERYLSVVSAGIPLSGPISPFERYAVTYSVEYCTDNSGRERKKTRKILGPYRPSSTNQTESASPRTGNDSNEPQGFANPANLDDAKWIVSQTTPDKLRMGQSVVIYVNLNSLTQVVDLGHLVEKINLARRHDSSVVVQLVQPSNGTPLLVITCESLLERETPMTSHQLESEEPKIIKPSFDYSSYPEEVAHSFINETDELAVSRVEAYLQKRGTQELRLIQLIYAHDGSVIANLVFEYTTERINWANPTKSAGDYPEYNSRQFRMSGPKEIQKRRGRLLSEKLRVPFEDETN